VKSLLNICMYKHIYIYIYIVSNCVGIVVVKKVDVFKCGVQSMWSNKKKKKKKKQSSSTDMYGCVFSK
jgi:cytochrome b subunit of formate dehydrogenase